MSAMPNPVVDLLRQHGFFGLAGYDGCDCGVAEVCGVRMDAHCRKSSGSDEPGFYGTTFRLSADDVPASAVLAAGKQLAREMRERETPVRVYFDGKELESLPVLRWDPDD